MDDNNLYNSPYVANRIKSYAKIRGVSLKSLLENCNLGSNAFSHMLHGRTMAFDSLARIADYLDCSVDYLLGRTDNPTGDNLSGHEKAILSAYRARPDMQSAVDTLLGIQPRPDIVSDMIATVAAGEKALAKTPTDTK